MALAKGKSQITCGQITVHTQTSIHIAETLTKVSRPIVLMKRTHRVVLIYLSRFAPILVWGPEHICIT